MNARALAGGFLMGGCLLVGAPPPAVAQWTQAVTFSHGVGGSAAQYSQVQWRGVGAWQVSEGVSIDSTLQLRDNSRSQEHSPSLRQTSASWGDIRQLAVHLQQQQWRYSVGLLAVDWRLTDTVALANVWSARDLSHLTEPELLAQPALRALWQGETAAIRQFEVLWSPAQRLQQDPAGIWQLDAGTSATAAVSQPAFGVKIGGGRHDRWTLWYFNGVMAAAQISQASAVSAIQWQHVPQQTLAATYQMELGDGWLSRTELGHIRASSADTAARDTAGQAYWQWVQGVEHEWVGETSSTVLLVQYSQQWRQFGQAPLYTQDMDQQLAGFWLGRLQYDPAGDMRQQWQLEWSIGTANQYWQARWQQRLGENHQLHVSWRVLNGVDGTLWGRYRQLDGIELAWRYWF